MDRLTPPWFCTLRSCGFLWLFDLRGRRFVRAPAEWPLNVLPPADVWVGYERLTIDARGSTFNISVEGDEHAELCCVLHLEPCAYCRGRRPVDVRGGGGAQGRVLVWRSPQRPPDDDSGAGEHAA